LLAFPAKTGNDNPTGITLRRSGGTLVTDDPREGKDPVLAALDPDLNSVVNVNTQAGYQAASFTSSLASCTAVSNFFG
jgi:hypothetical protein